MANSSDYLSENKKSKERNKIKKNRWIYYIFLITFLLSIVFGGISNVFVEKLNIVVAVVLLFVIILIGIAFDMIGMSVVGCDESTFHAKAAKKQKGAREAVNLVRYSDKVSSICNDVVGDVCGVISGAVSAMLAIKFANILNIDASIVTLVFGAIVASLTVGGKAIEKAIVIKHSEKVIYNVGKLIYYINPIKKENKKIKTKKGK